MLAHSLCGNFEINLLRVKSRLKSKRVAQLGQRLPERTSDALSSTALSARARRHLASRSRPHAPLTEHTILTLPFYAP